MIAYRKPVKGKEIEEKHLPAQTTENRRQKTSFMSSHQKNQLFVVASRKSSIWSERALGLCSATSVSWDLRNSLTTSWDLRESTHTEMLIMLPSRPSKVHAWRHAYQEKVPEIFQSIVSQGGVRRCSWPVVHLNQLVIQPEA